MLGNASPTSLEDIGINTSPTSRNKKSYLRDERAESRKLSNTIEDCYKAKKDAEVDRIMYAQAMQETKRKQDEL
jgi:hypothetical protein